MSHENFDFQTSWNLRFSPLEPETSSLFWLDTFVDIALTGQLYDNGFSRKKYLRGSKLITPRILIIFGVPPHKYKYLK
jgi:hypothetical protein